MPNTKLDISLFGYTWPVLTADKLAYAWGTWSFGVVMGTATGLTSNMPWNSCLQDITVLLVDAYSIYVYVYRNVITGDT